jgi:hypothetical protein
MTGPTTIATFNLPNEMMKNLNDIAADKKIDLQELVINYLEEGMVQDLQKVKWCDFICHAKELMHKHDVPDDAIQEVIDKFS